MRRSTRRFFREGQTQEGYTFVDFLHGYFYARWPYLYIGVALGEHRFAKVYTWIRDHLWKIGIQPVQTTGKPSAADTYHGKVLLPESAHALVLIDEEIELRDLEHVIPYPIARDIVMREPDHIVALECPCRVVREKPCLPLDVCLIVGEPFASFVLEHHPARSKAITRHEAVEVLTAEHERGHVHHAFFKDAMLGRFYAICNCCSCCCGAIQSVRNGNPMITSSGFRALIDDALCIGCERCHTACNFEALTLVGGVNTVIASKCMGCGICTQACPEGAIKLERDPSRGDPLEITSLMERAACIVV